MRSGLMPSNRTSESIRSQLTPNASPRQLSRPGPLVLHAQFDLADDDRLSLLGADAFLDEPFELLFRRERLDDLPVRLTMRAVPGEGDRTVGRDGPAVVLENQVREDERVGRDGARLRVRRRMESSLNVEL